MKSLVFLLISVAVWESILYQVIARCFGPGPLTQWAAHFVIRSVLGLLGYAVLTSETMGYGVMSLFHGEWVGWPQTLIVLFAFMAMTSGFVFAVITLPVVLIYLVVRRR